MWAGLIVPSHAHTSWHVRRRLLVLLRSNAWGRLCLLNIRMRLGSSCCGVAGTDSQRFHDILRSTPIRGHCLRELELPNLRYTRQGKSYKRGPEKAETMARHVEEHFGAFKGAQRIICMSRHPPCKLALQCIGRQRHPCVILFGEIDTLNRTTRVSPSHNTQPDASIMNQFIALGGRSAGGKQRST